MSARKSRVVLVKIESVSENFVVNPLLSTVRVGIVSRNLQSNNRVNFLSRGSRPPLPTRGRFAGHVTTGGHITVRFGMVRHDALFGFALSLLGRSFLAGHDLFGLRLDIGGASEVGGAS